MRPRKHLSRPEPYLRVGLRLAALLLAVLTLLSCTPFPVPPRGAPSAPIPPASPYVIPVLLDLTGPTYEEQTRDVKRPMDSLAAYVNRHKGGIVGRQVAFRYFSHESDPKRAASVWKQAVADLKPSVVLVVGSAASEAVKPLAELNHIPAIAPQGSGKLLYPPGWVFSIGPDYAEVALTFFSWALSGWNQPRPMRVAFVTADAPFGRAALRSIPEIERLRNVQVVANEFFPFVPVEPLLTRLKNTQPDYVYAMQTDRGLALLLRSARQIGLLQQARFVTGIPVGMSAVTDYAGMEATEGLMQIVQTESYDESRLPGVRQLLDVYNDDEGPAVQPSDSGWALSYAAATVLLNALEESVRRVGWDKLSSDAVFQTLDNGEFDFGGLTKLLSFAPDRRSGARYSKVFVFQNGRQVPASDWIPTAAIPMK